MADYQKTSKILPPIGTYRLDPERVRSLKRFATFFGGMFTLMGAVGFAFTDGIVPILGFFSGPMIILYFRWQLVQRLETDRLDVAEVGISQTFKGKTTSLLFEQVKSWRVPLHNEVVSNQTDHIPPGIVLVSEGEELQISDGFVGVAEVFYWIRASIPESTGEIGRFEKSTLRIAIWVLRLFVLIPVSMLVSQISEGTWGSFFYSVLVLVVTLGFVEGFMLRCPACGKNFLKRKKICLVQGLPRNCPSCDARIK